MTLILLRDTGSATFLDILCPLASWFVIKDQLYSVKRGLWCDLCLDYTENREFVESKEMRRKAVMACATAVVVELSDGNLTCLEVESCTMVGSKNDTGFGDWETVKPEKEVTSYKLSPSVLFMYYSCPA